MELGIFANYLNTVTDELSEGLAAADINKDNKMDTGTESVNDNSKGADN